MATVLFANSVAKKGRCLARQRFGFPNCSFEWYNIMYCQTHDMIYESLGEKKEKTLETIGWKQSIARHINPLKLQFEGKNYWNCRLSGCTTQTSLFQTPLTN